MPKKRDAKYFRDRLKRDKPAVYADLIAGKYTSVRAASAAAGLIHLPGRLDALKREWKRASTAERSDFRKWASAPSPAGAVAGTPIVDSAGHLRRDVKDFLSDWIATNRSKPGRILKEAGGKVHDATLSPAIYRDGSINEETSDRLVPWLIAKGFPGPL